jgi:hypothetical protein
MTFRFVTALIATVTLIAGFVLGRATGPRDIATAQMMPAPHYMCYQTQFATHAVALAQISDQFGTANRQFFRADMFCAPAKKVPHFKPMQVPGPANHLMCYHTLGNPVNAARKIANQLEQTSFTGLKPVYFCLPTFKAGG